jgi:predicted transposase YbfD/YdcC
VEKDHGRIEERNYFLCDQISWIPEVTEWSGLNAIGAVQSKRNVGSVSTTETRYFLTTLKDVSEFSVYVRKHWSIENNLHWSLDVCHREDSCQVRDANATKVLATMRKMAKFIIDKDKTSKVGQENRRKQAAWDHGYRHFLLNSL